MGKRREGVAAVWAAVIIAGLLGAGPASATGSEEPPSEPVIPSPETPDEGGQQPVDPPPMTKPAPQPATPVPPAQQPAPNPGNPEPAPVNPSAPSEQAPAPHGTDPVTGYQVDTSTGYLIHPGTGYLIEPVTGNLVNPTTWEYTGLIWDPETGEARDPSAEPSPTPTPSATPTASTSPSSSPSATAEVGPTASPSATALSAEVANSRGGNGWAMRGGVVVLLIGAGALYYLKLRGSGPAVPVGTGKTEE